MIFFPVVLGIMAGCILLVHWLTNYFGCRLEYKSLVLCAVMAFVVTTGSVLMTPYLTQDYYIRLGGFIFVAAGLVTAYNEYLIRQSSSLAVAGAADEFREEEEMPDSGTEEETSSSVSEEVPGVPSTETRQAFQGASAPPVASEAEALMDEATQPDSASDDEDISKEQEPESAAPETVPRKEAGVDTVEDFADILPHLTTLDDLLDYAYEQRSNGNIEEAVLANRKALACYAEDDYAPYIAIELGNIYKDQADYDAAIRVYEKALDIPVIARNDATYQEFAKNLSYLRTVQYILSKHNALEMPYSKIPEEYMEEIEADFQSRHTNPIY